MRKTSGQQISELQQRIVTQASLIEAFKKNESKLQQIVDAQRIDNNRLQSECNWLRGNFTLLLKAICNE